jgi:hypothetical protein
MGRRLGRILNLTQIGSRDEQWALPERKKPSRMIPLLLVLPMFGQVFHYMIDINSLYLLSKAWAVLMSPLALYAVFGLRTRFSVIYLMALIYGLGVTPVLSMLWLGNSLTDAIVNSVKIWSLSYYFSLLGLLVLMEPSPETLVKAINRLGLATVIVMWTLWFTAPQSWYSGDPHVSRLFLAEYERGNRIYFPMTFAWLSMLYALARLLESPKLWHPLWIAIVMATEILLFKERMALAASVLVMGGMVIFRLPPLWKSIAMATGIFGAAVGAGVVVLKAEKLAASLGGSLTIRQHSMELLQAYLGAQPLRWVFGAGAASRVGSVNMANIIGRSDFFLADLGWAGIIFEFGVFGAVLLVSLYLLALRWGWKQAAVPEPRNRAMVGALITYIAFLLVCTAIYSPVYVPGELASVTAMLLYMNTVSQKDAPSPKETRNLM